MGFRGSKVRAKIDQKSIKKRGQDREGLLDSSLCGFGWVWGAKLVPSWKEKSSQDRPRQAKTREDKGSEGKGRERKRKGRDCKGKVWKRVDGEIPSHGGGRPTLRGGLPRKPPHYL